MPSPISRITFRGGCAQTVEAAILTMMAAGQTIPSMFCMVRILPPSRSFRFWSAARRSSRSRSR